MIDYDDEWSWNNAWPVEDTKSQVGKYWDAYPMECANFQHILNQEQNKLDWPEYKPTRTITEVEEPPLTIIEYSSKKEPDLEKPAPQKSDLNEPRPTLEQYLQPKTETKPPTKPEIKHNTVESQT